MLLPREGPGPSGPEKSGSSVRPPPERRAGDAERLLGRRRQSLTGQFSRLTAENEPAKQQRIRKNGQRRYRGYGIADLMSGVHQAHSDRQDDRSNNPDPDLQESQAAPVNCRVPVIIDAKAEEGHPAQP